MPSARCRKDALLPASHHIEVEGGSHERVFTVAEENTTKDKPTSIMLKKEERSWCLVRNLFEPHDTYGGSIEILS